MSDEIVKSAPHQIIATFDDAERAARAMAGSGFFQDAKQTNQAVVKILAGQELGFGPFASMTGVAIIQGKPAVGANLQAAAVKRTGKYNYRVIEMTNEACELEFYEAGKAVGKSRFDMKDADAAGLSGKDNWKKWPRNMLFARAISNGVKWYAPDIFNGATVYTPDELGAAEDGDGNIIEVPAEHVQDQPAEEPAVIVEMTLLEAQDFLSSDGRHYNERETKELKYIAGNPKASPAQRMAARLIIDDRAKNEAPVEPPEDPQ